VPETSAVADIIRETGTGYVVSSNSDWGKELAKVLIDYKNNGFAFARNQEAIEKYSWKNISKQWLELICNASTLRNRKCV
jgi:glycosyltransferase involved in cell wall biosynthesis